MQPSMSNSRVRVLLPAGLLLFVSVGARQGFGLFLLPMAGDLGTTREAIATVIAVQYLVWGLAGPISGLIADRFGARPVLWAGAALYAAGFAWASIATDVPSLVASAGLAIGLGLGGANYGVVHGAVVRRIDIQSRGRALGAVNALTAAGQLLMLFATGALLQVLGWRDALAWHAMLVALIAPLAWWLCRAPAHAHGLSERAETSRGAWPALRAALRLRNFWWLCAGFAVSGAQVMFTMTHLPAMLFDGSASSGLAMWALAAVSLSAFLGSLLFGWAADRYRASRLLALLYAFRALFALAWLGLPFEPAWVIGYFALLGLVWTSTIPVASALTASLFGSRYLASLFGAVFLAHQVGGFMGTWLGGHLFERWHSYTAMSWLLAAGCTIGALLALRIEEAQGLKRDG